MLRRIRPDKPAARIPPEKDDRRSSEMRAFLESLGFAWRGFRKKRKRVHLRLYRRAAELGLSDLVSYRRQVCQDESERRHLHALLGITVTRFFRDQVDWEFLTEKVLEAWTREERRIKPERVDRQPCRAWSMGCASGEEPYTLRMCWLALPERRRMTPDDQQLSRDVLPHGPIPEKTALDLEILATDVRSGLLDRAREARYPPAAIHHTPSELARRYFRTEGASVMLDAAVRSGVRFEHHDYLLDPWPGGFDLILARNGFFTYRGREELPEGLLRIAAALQPGGFLFVGSHDILPDNTADLFDRVGRTLWRFRGWP